ncbi:hypothetical protein IAD21_00867 [Abditibacteriota bacterium]|nr:hypothetical protein IAD21_00867 [Abditibacteriota bacterium]
MSLLAPLTPPAPGLVLVLWNPTRFGIAQSADGWIGYVNDNSPLTLETAQELTQGRTPFVALSSAEKAALGPELGALKGQWVAKSSAVGNAVFYAFCREANLNGSLQLTARFIIEDGEPPNGYYLLSELLANTYIPDQPPLPTIAELLDAINDELDTKANSSALTAHTGNTSNPHSVTKAQVGLGNADNTSDANKPVSTATLTALNLKAPLASPALTGTPTAPTAALGTNTTQIATMAAVKAAIDALVAGAPGALDTLNEIAAQFANDESAVSALTTTVAGKLAKTSNLSDLTSAASARTNLGLGDAATKTTGGSTGQLNTNGAVLLGSRVVETNASGLFISVAKNSAYNVNFGQTTGTAAEGDDSRFFRQTGSVANLFLGPNAGTVATGSENTGVGYTSLRDNTTGAVNSAFGAHSLEQNSTGSDNAAFGRYTLGSNTTGEANTGVGNTALYANTGSYNVGIGKDAGRSNVAGNYNTFIGYLAGYGATSSGLTNATALGYNAQVTASNALILGNNVDVGIGVPAPLGGLHTKNRSSSNPTIIAQRVSGQGDDDFQVRNASGTLIGTLFVDSTGGLSFRNQSGTVTQMAP